MIHTRQDTGQRVERDNLIEAIQLSAGPTCADQAASERPQPLGDRLPDRPGTKQEHGLAGKLEECRALVPPPP